MADNPARPTLKAFVPTDNQQLKRVFLLGIFCLLIGLFGIAMWFLGSDGFGLLGATSRDTSDNLFYIMLASPLALIAACYFLYTVWRDWRQSIRFKRDKQQTSGTITHLWADSPNKTYYAGFQYAENSAYQEISRQNFNHLKVGDSISIDYLPQNPLCVRLIEPEKQTSSRKKSTDKN